MQSGSCGRNLRWTLDDDGTLTIGGEGDMNNYWYDSPWYKSERVKKVIVESGVTSIGKMAFEDCHEIVSVALPNSLRHIGNFAFNFCTSLRDVNIPDGVKKIGQSAFKCCGGLTSIIIPESVTELDDWTFDTCTGLTRVTIPDTVKTFGRGVFSCCTSLTSVTIPAGVVEFGDYVFDRCTNLKTIYCAANFRFTGLLSYGNSAKIIPCALTWQFDDGTLTVGGVRELNFVDEEPPWLDRCERIQKLVVGDGVEKISAHAFDNCPRLEVVTLPDSVKTIGDMAFPFSFCGDFNVNGGKNVFWCVEDGVLVVKKNPAAVGDDFSIGTVRCWRDVEKNIRGVKVQHGIKPTQCFNDWLFGRVVIPNS